MDKPLYDSIRGLAPTISIEQKSRQRQPAVHRGHRHRDPRLPARALGAGGQADLPQLRARGVAAVVASRSCTRSQRLTPGVKFLLLAPLVKDRKGEHRDVLDAVRKVGLHPGAGGRDRALARRRDPARQEEEAPDRRGGRPPRRQGRTEASGSTTRWRRPCATARARVIVAPEGETEQILSEHRACHHCGISFPEPSPQLFSFNSPQGMCPECSGLGTRMEMDPELVVPNPEPLGQRRRGEAAGGGGRGHELGHRHRARRGPGARDRSQQALEAPAPAAHRKVLLYGTGDERVKVQMRGSWGTGAFKMKYEGAINSMMRRMRETHSEEMRTATTRSSSRTAPARPAPAAASAPRPWGSSSRGKQHRRGHGPVRGRGLRLLRHARPQGLRREDRDRAPEGDPLAAQVPARRGPQLPHPRPARAHRSPAARASASAWPARSAAS